MVETILYSLASTVVGNLGSPALHEVGLAWGVEEELKTLEGTLSTIKAVLVDAERLCNHTPDGYYYSIEMRLWFERLEAAFCEADIVLDEFHYEALRRQVNHRSIGIQQLVRNFFSCSSSHTLALPFRFKMANKIKEIKMRLDMIAADRAKFHPTRPTEKIATSNVSISISSPLNESDFVGRDEDRKRILQLLMTPPSVDEKIAVIPIVGIAGLGKTTLVKSLYDDARVVEHFELRMWVRVARDFDVKHVMQKIIRCITGTPRADFNSNELQTILGEKVRARKFLLVLDDVCNCDFRDWVKFNRFLIVGANGSKIVVTTRNKSVAFTVGTVPMYNLEILSDKDCHELLLKWAGRKKVGEQLVNLSDIAMEIVKKCHGFPLAAKTLGNLLLMKTDENEWWYLKDKELWELEQNNKHDILPMLRFKYNPLPADLKRCFIYCSIFPKNYIIRIDKLIQLWMAQGLIQSPSLNHELEDIGIDYFNRLCSIFFLEKIKDRGNLLTMCRMPKIIHDLAVFMANEECLSTANYHPGQISEKVKHVSFCDYDCSVEGVTKSLFKLKNLRTIFFPFQRGGVDDKGFVVKCISNFKYLYVLDLSNSCFQKLPHSIGNLKHLRFIDLSGNANIEILPNAICKLYNLQTLRIWYCAKIRELPKNIGNLISLRHLYLTTQQSCLPEKEIRRLTSLRSFQITECENLTSLPEGMQFLTALTTVTITACPKFTSLPSTMKKLAKLKNFEIGNCPNLNLSGWDHVRGLRKLKLKTTSF